MTSTPLTLPTDGITARIRGEGATPWQAAVDHRFVRELLAGTVPDDALAGYLLQDQQFLDGFLRLLGQALASADAPASRLVLARQLGMLADDEQGYFEDSLAALGVPADVRRHPPLLGTTAAFQTLMAEVVASRSYPRLLVLLVVMEVLYLDWGSRTDLGEPTRPEHLGWVELHRGPDFTRWCQWLVDELERVAATCHPAERGELVALGVRTVELELAFFDQAR
ncbi:thiaminase (transcriptional activator TenA) [Auraticoccus monumenti]|uniref:Aminopyrimidine aminohydrolase n=1 Tax=Auraticoccus monumenti TaxID=675864 RepID=A0A1G7A5N9_9ACTN|nr:TenA family protein [Auraticoccus monumenti]SDE10214.1 thiaminase (transcriptional activator TenA) [Auraticoccus monumenti]